MNQTIQDEQTASGFWLKVNNERSVALQLLIEPWGVGTQMLPQSHVYVYVSRDKHTPEVIYQDRFVIAHEVLILLDAKGKELYNFASGYVAPPPLI